ncbi:hypothetical protein JCM11672_19750 [Alkaliphilus crotonatoxidans]
MQSAVNEQGVRNSKNNSTSSSSKGYSNQQSESKSYEREVQTLNNLVVGLISTITLPNITGLL